MSKGGSIVRLPHENSVRFDADSHTYHVRPSSDAVGDGWRRADRSVTALVAGSFERFDAEAVLSEHFGRWRRSKSSKYYELINGVLEGGGSEADARAAILGEWECNRARAASGGTATHELFEKRLRDPEHSPCAAIDSWLESTAATQSAELRPIAVEVPVFHEPSRAGGAIVAGCIDALFEDQHGVRPPPLPRTARRLHAAALDCALPGLCWLVDWKTSKNVCPNERAYRNGHGAASSLPDTSFHRYSLQLALYAALLRSCAGIDVGERRLIAHVRDDGIRNVQAETELCDLTATALLAAATARGAGQ